MSRRPNKQPVTAFVFAGGGSYGAAQVGMLRELCAHGIRPDLVAGSSVGAINGAFYAGMPDADGIERLESLWRGLRRQDVFPIALSSLLGALSSSDHLFEPGGLRRLLTANLPYSSLEDSVIPVHVMATDLLTGSPVWLSAGPAVAAVLASCAIPAIYPPVAIGGRKLVDGGIASNTPIRTSIELGATRLIILSTSFACPHATPPSGVLASAFNAMSLAIARQLDQDIRLYADQAEIVLVPPICPVAIPPYDFSNVARMIDQAARSTARWLEDDGLESGAEFPAASGRDDECVANLPPCVAPANRRRRLAQ